MTKGASLIDINLPDGSCSAGRGKGADAYSRPRNEVSGDACIGEHGLCPLTIKLACLTSKRAV